MGRIRLPMPLEEHRRKGDFVRLTPDEEKRIRELYNRIKCVRDGKANCLCTVCIARLLLSEIDALREELKPWCDLQADGTAMHFTPEQKAEREHFVKLLREDLECAEGESIRAGIRRLKAELDQLKRERLGGKRG